MSLTLGLALYFIIWWTVLFAVLPFAGRSQGEAGTIVPGTPASAPHKLRLARLFLINTVVAAVVFVLAWVAIVYRLLPLERIPG